MINIKENKYDDKVFFEKYSQMTRSKEGLAGAGEWQSLKTMLPDFKDKRVLDLGCGYGWHCVYAAKNEASLVVGIDISKKMLDKACELSKGYNITYLNESIEDYSYPTNSFDIVISSLAFHYIPSFEQICTDVYNCLADDGDFVFSVEHPIFTAQGTQDWVYDEDGNIMYWPVDNYFYEGERKAVFLAEEVLKYHRTLTSYVGTLLKHGFEIVDLVEPRAPEEMLDIAGMKDELRRPMMLLIAAKKRRK